MALRYNKCIKLHICAELVHLRQHRNVTEKAELYFLMFSFEFKTQNNS
jgi:hypothetical protein